MDYTTNYQLPVWAETDRILRTDFNDMTETLEEALSGLRDDVDANTSGLYANTAAHAHFGNCQLYTLSYVGTGGNSCSFSVPGNPVMAMALGANQFILGMRGQASGASYFGPDSCPIPVTLQEGSVSWTSPLQNQGACNSQGFPFALLVLLEK